MTAPAPTPPVSPPEIAPPPAPHQDNILRGIMFALAAYMTFGVMQALAKLLSETHNVIEVAFYRNLFALIPFVIFLAATNQWHKLKTKKPKALAFRGIFGTISLMITFLTFHYLPLATATVILFTAAVFTPAMAFFLLKERIGIHRWSAILIGLLGVIVMVRPGAEAPLFGIGLGFFTALLWSVINVTLRYLKTEHPLVVTFSFVVCGVIIPGLFMPFIAKMPLPHEWLLFIIVGVTGGLGQFFLTSAFRNAPASLISMFNYTGLLWATLFDVILWQYMPGLSVFIGAAIILAANAYIIHREKLAERKKIHSHSK